jgi:hypothetical protein
MIEYSKKDLELMVETVEAGGNDVKNPFCREDDNSVVQTSVEVTESSLLPDVVIVHTSCS